MLSPEYVAGVLDCDGWIGFNMRRDGLDMRVSVQVCMTDFDLPRLLHEQFGGAFNHVKQRGNSKPQFKWAVSNTDAAKVIAFCYEHLIVKKRQATLALHFVNTRQEYSTGSLRQEDIFPLFKEKMHELNKRGVA